MRISDWSSDVCSSDLSKSTQSPATSASRGFKTKLGATAGSSSSAGIGHDTARQASVAHGVRHRWTVHREWSAAAKLIVRRSEDRRVGKACVSTCTTRGSPDHYNKNTNQTSHRK